jgi:hypothetical protein
MAKRFGKHRMKAGILSDAEVHLLGNGSLFPLGNGYHRMTEESFEMVIYIRAAWLL